jgi:hypothetical protein
MIIGQLSRFTRLTLVISLTLLAYGYSCRIAQINFFWESKALGWAILLIALIGLLSDRITIISEREKNTILEKIGIGFLAFVVIVQTILITVIPFSNAYEAAKTYIINNEDLRNELGEIRGFGLMTTGAIQKTTDSSGEYGNAEIKLTIKGEKKFKDVVVFVLKNVDSKDWEVVRID